MAALSRTLGWTMVLAAANCELPVQRPCSTQKTSRGSGGAPTGTMRSLPMTRSCLPPLTSSPARSSNGRLLRLIRTSWLTEAPRGGSGGRFWHRANESQAAESGDTEQAAYEGGENRSFHESLLCVIPDPVRANQRGHDSGLERDRASSLH